MLLHLGQLVWRDPSVALIYRDVIRCWYLVLNDGGSSKAISFTSKHISISGEDSQRLLLFSWGPREICQVYFSRELHVLLALSRLR